MAKSLRGELDDLFGDTRIGDLEAAISDSVDSATAFGWPGWSMPKWSFTRSGVKQSTSDVVTLIGSFLNPPVSVVGAPTGKYYSARKYAYWAVLVLLAVALAYGAYRIVFRKKGGGNDLANVAAPAPAEPAFELTYNQATDGNSTVDWVTTISNAHEKFKAQTQNPPVITVAAYKTQMLSAYFALVPDKVANDAINRALDAALAKIARKPPTASVSEAQFGAIIDSALVSLRKERAAPRAPPATDTLDTFLKACDVGDGIWSRMWAMICRQRGLGDAQKDALSEFNKLLERVDDSTKDRIKLNSLRELAAKKKTTFGRNKAKRREERENRCQFLVPCGSHANVGPLCECEAAVSVASAVEGVNLCEKHSTGKPKKEEMAAFFASMTALRRSAPGVKEAEHAITGAIDEIRAAAVWGQGTASVDDAMGTMDDIKLGTQFGASVIRNLLSGGTYRNSGTVQIPHDTRRQSALATQDSARLDQSGGEQRLQSDAGASTVESRTPESAPPPIVVPPTDLDQGEPVARGASSGTRSGDQSKWAVATRPAPLRVRTFAGRTFTPDQQNLFMDRLFRMYLEAEALRNADTWVTVYDPIIARNLEADSAKRRELALKLDGEMPSRGSKRSVMRLLGHDATSEGSGDRNDTALSDGAIRNLAIGLVSRRANKLGPRETTTNNLILTGLKNIGTIDRTIAAIEGGKNMADPGVCYLSSTAVYEVLSWCVKLADSDSKSGTSGTSGPPASGTGLDAMVAGSSGHSCIVIDAIDEFRSALEAVEANDQNAFRSAVLVLIPVFSRAHEARGARSNQRESGTRARVIGRALKMLSTCVILQGPAEDPPESIEAVAATISDVRACVAVEDQKSEWRKMLSKPIELDIKGIIARMFSQTGPTAAGPTAAGPTAAQQSEFGMIQSIKNFASGAANLGSGMINAGSSALESGAGLAIAVAELSDVTDAVKACAKAIEEKLMFLIELFFGMFSLLATGTLSVQARTAISTLKLSGLSTQEQEDMMLGAKELERINAQLAPVPTEFGGQSQPAVSGDALSSGTTVVEGRHLDTWGTRAKETASGLFSGIWGLISGILTWVVDKLRKWNQNKDGKQRGSIVDVFGDITTYVIQKLGEWTTNMATNAPEGKAKMLGLMFGTRGPLAVDLLKRCRNWWSSEGGIMAILKNPAGLVGMAKKDVAAVVKYARCVRIALTALLAARLLQIMAVFGPRSGGGGPMGLLWEEMKTQMVNVMGGGA